jgi:ABC-2 type transport system ATP-binding protein
MDEAERCNRVGLLFQGTLVECGTPEAIKSHVSGQLIELRPEPLELAQSMLAGRPEVVEVQVYGDLLHVFVDDASRRIPQVRAALEAANIQVKGLRTVQPRMEEAFISLIRERQEVKRDA